ncbi:tRNA (adenine(58)-N(1))-methyltransferase, mitochondrial isoform X2 [Mauremys reevesii]|uniref:tRNA (adenine(58)-N(1))-methyltransferase, mitochondrial isoform X2 n=1 Tax=Mauremys reevesii TaxID=260615 RepID=UPI00193FB5D3|nr:tRNA (adenine(58)-N(1))-methyltransferase, mitochondrial isoform X2 [Mauremys reevesii]
MLQCARRRLSLQALGRERRALPAREGPGKPGLVPPCGRRRASWCRALLGRGVFEAGERLGAPRTREQGAPPLPSAQRLRALRALCSGSPRDGAGPESEEQVTAAASPVADSAPAAASQADPGQLLRSRRRRAWERALSPLERVSRLIPEELLSEELRAIRRADQGGTRQEDSSENGDSHLLQLPAAGRAPPAQLQRDEDKTPVDTHNTSAKDVPFQAGDLILAEFRRKTYAEFKHMRNLTAVGKLNSSWGVISHLEIIGKLPGQMFRTSSGFQFLIRRPALEDFVLLMKRGPTISYPKDINAMLMMMDINQGDTVVETGTGSGGMSLFLSRAVGPRGRVISYEIRKDHHAVAKKNYRRWRDAWEIGHAEEWPDNVDFINKDILTAAEDMKAITFDAVALDMLNPQIALPVVYPNLKQGGVCAVYLANITQVIDLLEGIRTCHLSLSCERIIEVTHRDWLVHPAKQKDGRFASRVEPKQIVDEELQPKEGEELPIRDQSVVGESDDVESLSDYVEPYGSLPYIARPYPWQTGHTAFLIKLRKYKVAYPDTAPDGSC